MITEPAADEDLQRRVEATCVDLLLHKVLTLNEPSKLIQIPPQTIKRQRNERYESYAVSMRKKLHCAHEDVIARLRYEAKKGERCSRDAYEPGIKTLR